MCAEPRSTAGHDISVELCDLTQVSRQGATCVLNRGVQQGMTSVEPSTAGRDSSVEPNTAGRDTIVEPRTAGRDSSVEPRTAGHDSSVEPSTAGCD